MRRRARHWVLLLGIVFVAAAPRGYELDGIRLGGNIRDVLSRPERADPLIEPVTTHFATYHWGGSSTGYVTAQTDANGRVEYVDVEAAIGWVRDVTLPEYPSQDTIVLGGSGHLNYLPPSGATLTDACGPWLVGAPCLAYSLPPNVELILNFGFARGGGRLPAGFVRDGVLSEIILGYRDEMNSGILSRRKP